MMHLLLTGCIALAGILPASLKAINCDPCDCKTTSHTFFSVRPVYQWNSPERLALTRHLMNRSEDGYNGGLSLAVLGGRSTKSERIARFFFPDCKQRLTINEAVDVPGTDILASNLNIDTVDGNFSSIIQICPRQTFIGLGITYQQAIAEFCEGRWLWFAISAPVLRVKNDMRLQECVIEDGGGVNPDVTGAVPNAIQAFKQPAWQYGRINNNCNNSTTKLGDLEILLGYQLVNNECCRLDSYAGGVFPTGNRPCGRTVFEPIVGSNKHYGVMFGSSLGIMLWEECDSSLEFAVDFNGQYMFKRTERRSLDLKNKPFSRYISTYANATQAQEAFDLIVPDLPNAVALQTPGINLFTLPLTITPGFTRVLNLAFVHTHCEWESELGYNFYAREAECAELACRFNESAAVKAITGQGATNPVRQIGDDFGGANDVSLVNYAQSIITAADLNLHSAAHPGVMSHIIYGAVGYHWDDTCYPTLLGGGASYEFSGDNTALHRWMIWGKLNVSF